MQVSCRSLGLLYAVMPKSFGLCSLGVAQRKPASVSSVYLGLEAMGSKRILSNSLEHGSAVMHTKSANESKGLAGEVLNSSKSVGQVLSSSFQVFFITRFSYNFRFGVKALIKFWL